MGPQGVPEQGPVGRYFELRDGSGSDIDKNFGFGSGIGYICKTNYQSGIIDPTDEIQSLVPQIRHFLTPAPPLAHCDE